MATTASASQIRAMTGIGPTRPTARNLIRAGADGVGRAHRPDQHHRLVALHDQVQEVGGLFHRVGAVGDDDAVDVLGLQEDVHAVGQLEPDLIVHVLAADVDQLLAGDLGELVHARRGVDQILHLEGA